MLVHHFVCNYTLQYCNECDCLFYVSLSVSLSVCLSVCLSLNTTCPNFTKFSLRVTRGSRYRNAVREVLSYSHMQPQSTRARSVVLRTDKQTSQTHHSTSHSSRHSPQKLPPPVDRSPNPTTCLIPVTILFTTPNRVLHRHSALDRQTDRQTSRWLEGIFDD